MTPKPTSIDGDTASRLPETLPKNKLKDIFEKLSGIKE